MNAPTAPDESDLEFEEEQAPQPLLRLYAIAIFAWSFDFRGATGGGGGGIQAVILLVYTVLFLRIMSIGRQSVGVGALWAVIASCCLFVVESSVVGLTEGQVPYAIFTNIIPTFVYLSAALLTYITLAASDEEEQTQFLNLLRIACIGFGVIHLGILVLTRGRINVADSRYEVLSGAVIPSLGIIAIVLVQKLARLDLAALTFNMFLVLLSVTRSLFIALAAQIFTVFIARPSVLFKSSTIKGITVFFLVVAAIVAADLSVGTGLSSRWIQRLSVSHDSGGEPTALTRSAETYYMMENFEATPRTLLFGNGLAAETSLTGPDAQRAARLVGWSSVRIHSTGFGHHSHASVLFVAGLLGGGALLLVQFVNGLQAIGLIRKMQFEPLIGDGSMTHMGVWGGVIVVGFLAVGFWSGTMGDRDLCLWYGIGTGMLYWAREADAELDSDDELDSDEE